MKLMLTSFGIDGFLNPDDGTRSLFHRMPPVSFRTIRDTFLPDYDLILLCDKLVMDEASFHRLTEEPVPAYSQVADTFSHLHREGRIELVDFDSVLRVHADLLRRMVDQDLQALDQWIVPLRESIELWRRFSSSCLERMDDLARPGSLHTRELEYGMVDWASSTLIHLLGGLSAIASVRLNSRPRLFSDTVDEALASPGKRRLREHKLALRETLTGYLRYVDANLILSNALQVGFHDWLDFTPFYTAKFMSVGKGSDPTQEQRAQVEKLFTVPFPDLAIRNTSALMKALNDKRIGDLRDLIAAAANGRVEFDQAFAKSILKDVLSAERTSNRWRNISGYLTMPLGLIPGVGAVADKVVGETLGAVADKVAKSKHRWFYMLSEIAESSGT